MCWTQLSSIITAVASAVTAGATCAIVYLTCRQKEIAKQKRKDDLFKIRWEAYEEITNYIKDTYERNCIFCASKMADHREDTSKKQEFLRAKTPKYPKELTLEQYYLISKIKKLFDAEIANLIQKFMSDFSFELIANSIFEKHADEPNRINEKWTYSWLPSPEFEEKFDEYLKLK